MNRTEALTMARESLQATPAVHAVADLIMLIDPMKERIEKLEELVNAVSCGRFAGPDLEDVNGVNWFDARDAILNPKPTA
jgi:hypothetical protein